MSKELPAGAAEALLAAQGLSPAPQSAEGGARFASTVLANSSGAFADLAFEAEPAGYTAALRDLAP